MPSRREPGTSLSISSVDRMMIGNMMNASTTPPDNAEKWPCGRTMIV